MIKLYRFRDDSKEYWETWDNDDGSHTVHWGVLGTEGKMKNVKSSFFKRVDKKIQEEISRVMSRGFKEIEFDDHHVLLVEHEVDGMGAVADVEKRHRLEEVERSVGLDGAGGLRWWEHRQWNHGGLQFRG